MALDKGVTASHKIMAERKVVVVTSVCREQLLGSMRLRESYLKLDKLGSVAYNLLVMQLQISLFTHQEFSFSFSNTHLELIRVFIAPKCAND